MESKEFSEFGTVSGIFVNSKLNVLGELFVEDLEVFLVFGNGGEHFESTFDNILTDQFDDTILLKVFSGNVKRKIIGINNTLEEVKVFWNEILAIVHNENSTNVQFDVVELLLWFKEIIWSTAWNKEANCEANITFDTEMLDS